MLNAALVVVVADKRQSVEVYSDDAAWYGHTAPVDNNNDDNQLSVYVLESRDDLARLIDAGGGDHVTALQRRRCGFVTSLNGALSRPRLHVQCAARLRARYVYIAQRSSLQRRGGVDVAPTLCDVVVYQ